MSVVFVTGSNGQLGSEIRKLAAFYPQFSFRFTDIDELSITDEVAVRTEFEKWLPEYCINCAAYTAVDRAETDIDTCRLINATAVQYLAKASIDYGSKLLHVSTDYVYDGTKNSAYIETDATNPQSTYGLTKLEGEELAMAYNPETLIIRTSWVYSSFGNNFVKTMMRLMKERDNLNVVGDQVGSPTYAKDLADAIIQIIVKSKVSVENWQPGIYHFSNEAEVSWFDFAVAIKEEIGSSCAVNPIPTSAYPTPAKRPMYSLMDKSKFVATFQIPLQPWKNSLQACINLLPQ
ncbi:MAG: dTDP-4-dehydrorhamnose reductase [Chitinophagaceae bacterium]